MSSGSSKPRRALLTGATGYLGSNLLRHLLAGGWDVDVIVREGSNTAVLMSDAPAACIRIYGGSARSMYEIVGESRPDVVFHLASRFLASHQSADVDELLGSNILFATHLVDAMACHGLGRLVNTGTSWQHFNDDAYNPVNLYAATKQAFEDILAYYVQAHGFKVATLVLFDTYGPRDPRPKLIHLLWRAALTQEPLSMSPGDQLVDLVHVDDVVRAYVMAAETLTARTAGHARYGISSGTPLKLREVALAFERATQTKLPIEWGGRPYRSREVMTPWKEFVRLPGWVPLVRFEEAIVHTRP